MIFFDKYRNLMKYIFFILILMIQMNSPLLHKQQFSGNVCYWGQNVVVLFHQHSFFQLRKGQSQHIVEFTRYRYEEKDKSFYEDFGNKTNYQAIYGICRLAVKTFVILVTDSQRVADVMGHVASKAKQFKFIEIGQTKLKEPLLSHLEKSFAILDFYFSSYDLTKRMQHNQLKEHEELSQLFWANYNYTTKYSNFPHELLTKFIYGFVQTKTIQQQQDKFKLTLISRGSTQRVGRRWLRRGIRDGNPGTHYETQQILQISSKEREELYSVVEIRASLPIVWSQNPDFSFKAPIAISKDECLVKKELINYIKHQQSLEKRLKIICLLDRKGKQSELGYPLEELMKSLKFKDSTLCWFQFNAQYQKDQQTAFSRLIDELRQDLQHFGYLKMEKQRKQFSFTITKRQNGIFRTNCLHCLDRTNFIQSVIAEVFLQFFIDSYHNKQQICHFPFIGFQIKGLGEAFKQLWMKNACQICQQNSGGSAMKMDLYKNGIQTKIGRLRNMSVGISRYFPGIFSDSYLQNCLDLHFGKLDPSNQEIIKKIAPSRQKSIFFAIFLLTVILMAFGTFQVIGNLMGDSNISLVCSCSGVLLTLYLGSLFAKRNRQKLIKQPIIFDSID